MGFKSIMKKVGKVALKVAPYAAYAIPGVGPMAGMAIQAGLGAANAKASGAGWKGIGLGAGLGAASSGIPIKGLGPSAGVASKATGTAAKLTKGAVAKSIIKNTATNILTGNKSGPSQGRYPMDEKIGGGYDPTGGSRGGINWGSVVNDNIGKVVSRVAQGRNSDTGGNPSSSTPTRTNIQTGSNARIGPSGNVMPRGGYNYDDDPMNQVDQRSPNLAQSIFQGRQQGIKNQPFRAGYDVNTQVGEPDEEGNYKTVTSRMPQIYSSNDSADQRRRAGRRPNGY